jgi:hypothetical protein
MSKKPRPSVSDILRFADEISVLCSRYGADCWLKPYASITRIELEDLKHLPKAVFRSGVFCVSFIHDKPQHRPVRQAEWYVYTADVNDYGDNLEQEFVYHLLTHTL